NPPTCLQCPPSKTIVCSAAAATHPKHVCHCVLYLMIPRPPSSTLFPYTTLFRSEPFGVVPRERAQHAPEPRDLRRRRGDPQHHRSEEHTSELQSHLKLVCRLLLEKKKSTIPYRNYTPRHIVAVRQVGPHFDYFRT